MVGSSLRWIPIAIKIGFKWQLKKQGVTEKPKRVGLGLNNIKMKKLIITSVLGLSILALNAQVEVTTQKFWFRISKQTQKLAGWWCGHWLKNRKCFCKHAATHIVMQLPHTTRLLLED